MTPRKCIFLFFVLLLPPRSSLALEAEHKPFLANAELGLYYDKTRACAVTSTYYLLREVGRSASLSEIARNIRVGQDGSNAADICAYLKALDVPYLAVKTASLDAITSSLAPAKRAAILHVDKESHFLTVNRRKDGSLVAFDGVEVIGDNVGTLLKQRFSGSAIIAGANVRWAFYAKLAAGRIVLFLPIILLGFILGRVARTVSLNRSICAPSKGPKS
ncbi:MAG: hypothetical protein JSU94_14425 [Phycisphaerales bacterium]|nr:MAG: hypothetical protein JSU94_14425 [Phycisphaerales bacterium]